MATSGSFALAGTHDYIRGISISACLNAVATGAQDSKRLIGGIHFKDFIAVESPHANIDRSFRELDLNGTVVQVEERKTSAVIQADGRRTQLQFCAGSLVGPDPVARRDGTVGKCLHPILFTGWFERNRALYIVQPRHASWRVVIIRDGRLWEG